MLQSVWSTALIFFPICNSIDTIISFQSPRDGETIISAGENFVFDFFSPGNSTNRYVGIWYKTSDQMVVWTANGENPVRTSFGVLTINGGNLVLLDGGHNSNITPWSTNVSCSTMANESSATLKDDGNLVLTDDHGVILWETFDYPTNTFIPGMKMGLNLGTSLKQILTSWKSVDDAAPGEYSLGIDPAGMPQNILRKGSDPIRRSGPWKGERLTGVPLMNCDADADSWIYVANDDEIYLTFKYNSSITMASVLHHSGLLNRMTWNDKNRPWNQIWLATQDRCDGYATCGAYGSCNSSRVVECECLRGFEEKKNSDWKGARRSANAFIFLTCCF